VFIKNRLGMVEGTETMLAQERRLNQIANNLANVDTAGYKKEDITFWEMMFTTAERRPRVGKALKVVTDHRQGPAEQTGNPLDLAIMGKGYFKIQTPNGVRYTRNGNFTLNGEGQLSTMDGHMVLGQGGPIILDSDDVQVGRDGTITVRGRAVNQLAIVTFTDESGLVKEGASLFRPKGPEVREVPAERASVQQGFLEGANINMVTEMIEMIDLQRNYQSQQKVIQTIDDINGQSISKVGNLTS